MGRVRSNRLVWALAFAGASGCGEYLGYRAEATKRIEQRVTHQD